MSDALPQRDRFDPLDGLEGPAADFEAALGSGRLHHAWLLAGPQGLGKAGFAMRAARRLLGAKPDPAFGVLGSSPADPANRLIAARSHPDLLVLQREVEDGKPRRNIPVDEARQLPEFFSKAPAMAGYRVALIDAADDLNVNAANAVLKTLEEPPARGVLLLVSHAPGRLLPTIRSRCRRLVFRPWALEGLTEWLVARGVPPGEAARRAQQARGSPGKALAGEGAVMGDGAALLDALPNADPAVLLKLSEGFRGAPGAERFAVLLDDVGRAIRDRSALAAEQGDLAGLERWAAAWERVTRAAGEAEALNLDRADAFYSLMTDLAAAARTRPLAA